MITGNNLLKKLAKIFIFLTKFLKIFKIIPNFVVSEKIINHNRQEKNISMINPILAILTVVVNFFENR